MQNSKKENLQVELARFEIKLRKYLQNLQELAKNDRKLARKKIDEVRSKYLLQVKTIEMFRELGLIQDYTNLLKDFNKSLDTI